MTGGPGRRLVRGLTALAALFAGVVGLPYVLVVVTGQLAPVLAVWADPAALLRVPDPVAILVPVLLVGAWLAWLVFLLGVLGEVLALASGHRIRIRLPGLASVQRLTAGLLVSVVAMLTTTQASSADPAPPLSSSALPTGTEDQPAPRSPAPMPTTNVIPGDGTAQALSGTVEGHVHVVERGDDLWSLAQQYYESGSEWRRIALANPGQLTGGPDRLEAGWRLLIPGVSSPAADGDNSSDGRVGNRTEREPREVKVHRDDTLSAIAERFYGAERRWPILWNANRHQLDDPDELTIGMKLVVPYRERWEGDRNRKGDRQRESAREDDRDKGGDRQRRGEPPEKREGAEGDRSPASDASRRATNEEPSSTPDRSTCTADDTGAPSTASPVPAPAPEPSSSPEIAAQPGPPPDPPPPPPGPDRPSGVESEASGGGGGDLAVVAAALGSAGALLAAAVIAGLALRRRQQLQARPVGRRILHPTRPAQALETALGHRARPVSLRSLDLALRAISAHCHEEGVPLPPLTLARIADERLELRLGGPPEKLPSGFRAEGDVWVIDAKDVEELKAIAGLSEAVRPYPALVTLGTDVNGHPVVGDLEGLGLLRLRTDDPQTLEAALAAMAVELSFSPWAEEMSVTLVGPLPDLPDALGQHNVTHTDDLAGLLDRFESRAAVQRAQLRFSSLARQRVDPDLADPWAPEIVLINQPLDVEHEARLHALLTAEPRVSMAAVLPWTASTSSGWTLRLEGRSSSERRSVLEPLDLGLTPQLLERPAAEAVLELARITGSELTTAAPWWSSEDDLDPAGDPDPPLDNVSHLGFTRPRRFGGWTDQANGTELTDERALEMTTGLGTGAGGPALHPTLLMLGPVELVGAGGSVPPKSAKQCLEYCGWLLENPGATAHAMTAALVVAESTRRSNTSRLRSWLGSDSDGTLYLPDAYSGRIVLSDLVSSDWQRLQLLTAHGINRASTNALRTALELVRGAPLADAAPGQWLWAEELRTDMISAVRDLGVELADRALDENDIDLARWAAARALVAAPGDELLLVARIRTEHQAGHRSEVERLTLRVTAQARQLGVDLAPETVTVLQQMLEGRARARLA